MTMLPNEVGRDVRAEAYAALARDSGGFSMVALDQRGSMENLFRDAGLDPEQTAIDDFRAAAVDALTPDASAVLLERGFLGRRTSGEWTGPCSLIVASDRLVQPTGMPLESSHLDPDGGAIAAAKGAVALKLLVLWHAGGPNLEQLATVDAFVDLAREHDLLAIVEGIVRPASGATATSADLIEAAVRLSSRADIYKAQVPIHAGDRPADVTALSRDLTAAIGCPWVVLSAGVDAARFPEFVAASCRGGASGFLAGRAIWGGSLGAPDQSAHLRAHAAPQLRELTAIVDAEARPWSEAQRVA